MQCKLCSSRNAAQMSRRRDWRSHPLLQQKDTMDWERESVGSCADAVAPPSTRRHLLYPPEGDERRAAEAAAPPQARVRQCVCGRGPCRIVASGGGAYYYRCSARLPCSFSEPCLVGIDDANPAQITVEDDPGMLTPPPPPHHHILHNHRSVPARRTPYVSSSSPLLPASEPINVGTPAHSIQPVPNLHCRTIPTVQFTDDSPGSPNSWITRSKTQMERKNVHGGEYDNPLSPRNKVGNGGPARTKVGCPVALGRKRGWGGPLSHNQTSLLKDRSPICTCGAGPCRTVTVGNGENAGRKYYACPILQGHGACSHHQWLDCPIVQEKEAAAPNARVKPWNEQEYQVCPVLQGHGACSHGQLLDCPIVEEKETALPNERVKSWNEQAPEQDGASFSFNAKQAIEQGPLELGGKGLPADDSAEASSVLSLACWSAPAAGEAPQP